MTLIWLTGHGQKKRMEFHLVLLAHPSQAAACHAAACFSATSIGDAAPHVGYLSSAGASMFALPQRLLPLPPALQQHQTAQQHHVGFWRPTLIQEVELQDEVRFILAGTQV